MNEQVKTSEIQVRNQGHKTQYYTLKLFVNGVLKDVHTSKSLPYLRQIENNFYETVSFLSLWGNKGVDNANDIV